MEPQLENLQFSGACSRFGQVLSNGMKRCMQATDNGINRMDRFGGALGNLGTGIGKLGTGVAVGATAYHDIYGNKKNTHTVDLSATPYHLIWYIIFIDFI